MEEVSNLLQNVMSSYGFWGCATVIVIMIVTQLVKWPLKNKAESWANATGEDKKVLTCWFVFIPIVVSLIFTALFYIWRVLGWHVDQFSWSAYLSESSVFSSVSVAVYEAIDAFVKAKVLKEAKALGVDASTASISKISAAYKAAKKEEKIKAKQEKSSKEAEEKAKSAAQAKADRIAKLKAELAEAEGTAVQTTAATVAKVL